VTAQIGHLNVPSKASEPGGNAPNEPTGGQLLVVSGQLSVDSRTAEAIDEPVTANATAAHEIVPNEPTGVGEIVTNEPTAVRQNVPNEPKGGELSVVSYPLPINGYVVEVDKSDPPNQATAGREGATNEPTEAHEYVTNEPRLAQTNEPNRQYDSRRECIETVGCAVFADTRVPGTLSETNRLAFAVGRQDTSRSHDPGSA
jgi:hypothetical protein